jgi:hypothetical protein
MGREVPPNCNDAEEQHQQHQHQHQRGSSSSITSRVHQSINQSTKQITIYNKWPYPAGPIKVQSRGKGRNHE